MNEEHITQDTHKELEDIQSFLEVVTGDEVNELIERLSMLNSYMARTGYLLAVATADRDRAMAGVFAEHQKSILKMPATVSQKFINCLCDTENYYVTWIERLNRACVHQGDNIRTQISFAKENLSLTKRGY